MNLRDLRYLVAVAERRHFGRAAEACHVSQPTLSAQLKKLEDSLGVTLFERGSKGVAVTPIGEEILRHARQVLEQADAIVEIASARRGQLVGPLRLGIIPTLGPYLLPFVLAPIGKKFPDLKLILNEDLTGNLVAQLKAHEIDAAVLALPLGEGEFDALPLFDEPFWIAYPPGHPLAAKKKVSERDLRDANLLLLAEGHCLRDQALSVCGRNGRGGEGGLADLRASSLETLRQMAAAGHGCTLLPALAMGASRRGGRLEARPLELPKAERRIGLVFRKSFPRRAGLETLARFILGKLPDSVRPLDGV